MHVQSVSDGRSESLAIAYSGGVLRSLKTSEVVARDIVRDILDRGLHEGSSLPSEAAMLQQYGVSRESLREGLRLLEVQGLISIRRGPGGGPIVGAVDPANLGRMSTLFYELAGATYGELLEAWVVAETFIAELAARNPDRAAVRDAMAPYLAEAPDHGRSLEEFVRHHLAFHNVLGALARNKVMQLSLMAIGQIVTHHVAVIADPREVAGEIQHDHGEIAAAVAAGHPVKARQLMGRHIRRIADSFAAVLGDQMHEFVEWR
jgi:GntR family transcriptional repressor for pyruvate dehydrogenase complex